MKKGFTLIELLAVIIILGVISTITYSVITNNIKTTKMKSFEISAQNLLESAKEYVTKNMENNDFPEGGIDVTNDLLEIKNNPFESGIIKRNELGQIVLENVTNGDFCANGTKNNLNIEEGTCESSDETPPELKLKVIKVGTTTAQIMIKIQDSGSGIESYEVCSNRCETYNKENQKTMIKDVIKLTGLNSNQEYKIKVTATNGANNDDIKTTTKEITIKTVEIEEPKFKISTNTYATNKVLTITYPENDGNYEYTYIKYGPNSLGEKISKEVELKETTTTEIEIEKRNDDKINVDEIEIIKEVEAIIKKDGVEIIKNSILIDGIDVDGPVVNVVIPNINEWTREKEITIEAIDDGVGLALRPYSFDKKEWQKENSKIVTTSISNLIIRSRDRLGNINKEFTINGTTKCNEENICSINMIDKEGPIIKYEVISGTKTNLKSEWYTSDEVIVKATITDQVKINENVEEGGIGVNADTVDLKIKPTGSEIKKINDTTYHIIIKTNGEFEISGTAEDKLGNKSKNYKVTIKKDNEKPSISSKNQINNYLASEVNKKVTEYINASYGSAGGGTITCKYNGKVLNNVEDIYIISKSTTDIQCTAVGNNGLSNSAVIKFRNYYEATFTQKTCYDNVQECKDEVCCVASSTTHGQSGDDWWCTCDGKLVNVGSSPTGKAYHKVCKTVSKPRNCSSYDCLNGGVLNGTICEY